MKKIFLTFLFMTMFSTPAFCAQNLMLTNNSPYLMIFDKKITRVVIGNSSIISTEVLTSLLNDGQSLLIKPIKTANTSLTVYEGGYKHNYSIQVAAKDSINEELGGLELDRAYNVTSDSKINFSVELDKPPLKLE